MPNATTDQTPLPTTLADIHDLAVVPVFATDRPNYAGLVGASRFTAYNDARLGRVPTRPVGRRVVVPVPALLGLLGVTIH